MYQRCFDNAIETLFEQGKTPRFSRFVISDDPNWESGHHVHDNETELIYVKKGVARLIIDSSLYVAHAGDIVVIVCHRWAKRVVCAGTVVLQHADPRHRRGNRRRRRSSGRDEWSVAGRKNVSARHRNGRGDGGFCAGDIAGRAGGIYSDEPQIADADPCQRCLSAHSVV